MPNITRIWVKQPNKVEFIMNEIDYASTFRDTKCPSGLKQHTFEGQMAMAKDIVAGWRTNGNREPGTTYRIEQTTGPKILVN